LRDHLEGRLYGSEEVIVFSGWPRPQANPLCRPGL